MFKSNSIIVHLRFEKNDSSNYNFFEEDSTNQYENIDSETSANCFKERAQGISNKVKEDIKNIDGSTNNAQLLPKLELVIVKTIKLFPCWFTIMTL